MAAVLLPCHATGAEKTISGVPNYEWYGGCGPTAAGMIVGYWDDHGYGNLITAGDGTNSWTTNRDAVKAMIASDGYFDDWYPEPDREEPPAYHADDCVADFMAASRGAGVEPGWSSATKQGDGMTGYAAYRGYAATEAKWVWYDYLWETFVGEIDAGRPMEFYVDSSGDGSPDHFVTAFGYDDAPGARRYYGHDTSGGAPQWHDFAGLSAGAAWGISTGTWFTPFTPGGPTAAADGPYTLDTDVAAEIQLDGSGSSDADAVIIAWEWDLNGDWLYDVTGQTPVVSAGLLESLGWNPGDTNEIALEVTDHLYYSDRVVTTLTYIAEPGTPGDVNGDANVDNLDITPFMAALTGDEAHFELLYPAGEYWAADVNEDGNVDNLDITPFVALLAGGDAIPEPAALSLLALGGLALIRRRGLTGRPPYR